MVEISSIGNCKRKRVEGQGSKSISVHKVVLYMQTGSRLGDHSGPFHGEV